MTFDDVLDLDRDTTFFHRYLQPMTGIDGHSNVKDVIKMVLEHSVAGRWAMSTQAHKTWSIR